MRLQGQQVVIFGGSSGIGLATARRSMKEGAKVVIAGTDREKLARAAEELGDVAAFGLDVMDEEAVAELFAGLGVVHHVLNTAGGVGGAVRLQGPIETLMAPVDVRLKGSVLIAKHAIPKMHDRGSVTFMSGAGKYKPFPGAATSLAAAGAVEVLAKSLASEAAPIRFNVLCPGLIDTPLLRSMFPEDADERIAAWTASFPVPRAGYADEVADAAFFLMSNGYVTGEVLVIDGGWRLT
jgi:NAD(P)-dependent dehydrogenase (short-subunit alcohol dehydrogenase family)